MSKKSSSIDVCLAAYNGEKYLNKQLNSILIQNKTINKIIISDDASEDGTVNIVKDIKCDKIRLFSNIKNLKHVKNFEKVISHSSAEVIFLCDQDDVWLPHKIETVMHIFDNNPDVVMVHHNLSTINNIDDIIQDRYINIIPGKKNSYTFLFLEFLRPRLFGCAMAFRSCVRDVLLPFPSCVYAHDHWISIAAACQGRIYFLDENLVLYRQHGNNLTPKSRRSIFSVIKSRFLFLQMIFISFKRMR